MDVLDANTIGLLTVPNIQFSPCRRHYPLDLKPVRRECDVPAACLWA
jgi:hypothetical protein